MSQIKGSVLAGKVERVPVGRERFEKLAEDGCSISGFDEIKGELRRNRADSTA